MYCLGGIWLAPYQKSVVYLQEAVALKECKWKSYFYQQKLKWERLKVRVLVGGSGSNSGQFVLVDTILKLHDLVADRQVE